MIHDHERDHELRELAALAEALEASVVRAMTADNSKRLALTLARAELLTNALHGAVPVAGAGQLTLPLVTA